MRIIAILIGLIVIIGCITLSFKYLDYKKDKDRIIVTDNEETISILTHKISNILGEIYSFMDTYSHEGELCKNLMELSEELLYINSRNTNRINEIANEICSIEDLYLRVTEHKR